jgi:hypothetical protein
MTTVYTPLFRFWEGQQGDPSIANAWGTPNSENMTLVEQAIAGITSIDLTGQASPYTLSTANGAPDQARSAIFSFFGTLTGDITINIPNEQRIGYALNNTTGGFNVILSAGAGAKATLPSSGVDPLWQYSADGAGAVGVVAAGFDTIVAGKDPNFYLQKQSGPTRWALNFQAGQYINYDATSINVNCTTGNINLDPAPTGVVSFCNNPNFYVKNSPANFFALSFEPNQFISYDSNTGDGTLSFTAGQVVVPGGRVINVSNFGFLNNDPTSPTGYAGGTFAKTVGMTVTNNIVAAEFESISDGRLKQNVVTIPAKAAVDWVKKSRGVTYLKDGMLASGFIAQEQADVLLHALSAVPRKGMDEYRSEKLNVPRDHALTLAYNNYIAYLQTALKSAIERIEVLENMFRPHLADAAD